MKTLYSCIQVGTLLDKVVLARVSYLDKQIIRMALDAGISGIILSTVETLEQAQEFYDYCIYPYRKKKESFKADHRGIVRKSVLVETGGERGQGLVRENLWGSRPLKFRRPLIIPQIETVKGVSNIESISKLDFDYYLVGPYDLSASLGEVGNFNSEPFKDCLRKLQDTTGNKLGLHIPSNIEAQLPHYKDYNFLALGMDTTFLVEKIKEIVHLS